MFLGRPLFLFPLGFHVNASLVMLVEGFSSALRLPEECLVGSLVLVGSAVLLFVLSLRVISLTGKYVAPLVFDRPFRLFVFPC